MGMRRYQCHILRCEFKIDSKSKWLEHLAVEHRMSAAEIEEVSLKRKRTRIGGAHRKAALLNTAPVNDSNNSIIQPNQSFNPPELTGLPQNSNPVAPHLLMNSIAPTLLQSSNTNC